MPISVVHLCLLLVPITFAWAGLAKIVLFPRWHTALHGYGLSKRMEAAASIAVPTAEIGVVALILFGRSRAAGALALALLAAFSFGVLHARTITGTSLPCGCFGGAGTRDYRALIARNAILVVATAPLILFSRDVGFGEIDLPASELLPFGLAAIGIGCLLFLAHQLSRNLGGHHR